MYNRIQIINVIKFLDIIYRSQFSLQQSSYKSGFGHHKLALSIWFYLSVKTAEFYILLGLLKYTLLRRGFENIPLFSRSNPCVGSKATKLQ